MSLTRGPLRRCAPRSRRRRLPLCRGLGRSLGWGCAALLCTAGAVLARSTVTARFQALVAGPGVEQTGVLELHCFPGDGEALLEVRGAAPAGGIDLLGATSSLGVATVQAGSLRVDYRRAPIGAAVTDSVRLQLVSRAPAAALDLELLTNADDGAPYRTTAELESAPPLKVQASVRPTTVYPGETVELVVRVADADPQGRALEALGVDWPAALVPTSDETARSVPGPEPALELRRSLRVRRDAVGPLTATAHVAGGGLQASPVALEALSVGALPVYTVTPAATPLRLGETATLTLAWRNPGEAPLPVAGLEAVAVGGLARARLASPSGGVRLEADEEKGSVSLQVPGPLTLAPGETRAVRLEVEPRITGPLTLSGAARPVDRERPVPLGGADVIRVVAAEVPGTAAAWARTDLELASGSLEPALRQALADAPLPRGAEVALTADRNDDGNWVVEGLLADLLRERGVRVLADSATSQLHFRLADARVVYSPAGSGWNLFADSRRRDARTEVYLRLASGQRVRWTGHAAGDAAEARAPGVASWLGGARGIDQAKVEADHRFLEFGLSGMIAGGLFFVFFAP